MKHLLATLLVVILSCTAYAQEFRDVVYLKNGSVIKGFYKSFDMNDTLRMQTLDGSSLVCPTSDIVRIAKERTDVYVIQRDDEDGLVRRWRPKGYSGSIEFVESFHTDASYISGEGLATVHGYRFNRHLFLGLGFGFEKITAKFENVKFVFDKNNYSFFTEGRWYVMHTLIAPVISCRAGYSFNGFEGPYVAPGIGVDVSVTPRFGAFLRFQYRWERVYCKWSDFMVQLAEKDGTYNDTFLVFSGGIRF